MAWWVMSGQGLGHVACHWSDRRGCFLDHDEHRAGGGEALAVIGRDTCARAHTHPPLWSGYTGAEICAEIFPEGVV